MATIVHDPSSDTVFIGPENPHQVVAILGMGVILDASVPRGKIYLLDGYWHLCPGQYSMHFFYDLYRAARAKSLHAGDPCAPTQASRKREQGRPRPMKYEEPMHVLTHHAMLDQAPEVGALLWHKASQTYWTVSAVSSKKTAKGETVTINVANRGQRLFNEGFRNDYDLVKKTNLASYIQGVLPSSNSHYLSELQLYELERSARRWAESATKKFLLEREVKNALARQEDAKVPAVPEKPKSFFRRVVGF